MSKRVDELQEEISKLQVQLASCALAAEGNHITCEESDYGWTPAFEEIRQLRASYERLKAALEATLPYVHGLIRVDDVTPPPSGATFATPYRCGDYVENEDRK